MGPADLRERSVRCPDATHLDRARRSDRRAAGLDGYQADLAVPLRTGTSLLVGALLLVAVASVRRWQQWPQPAADAAETLVPDEVIPSPRKDRPLGADGLGLSPRPEPELVRAGGSVGAGRSDPAGGSEWAGRSDWVGVLSGDSGNRFGRSSDWPRQRSS